MRPKWSDPSDAEIRKACEGLGGMSPRDPPTGIPAAVIATRMGMLAEELRCLPDPQFAVVIAHYTTQAPSIADRAAALGLSEEWYRRLFVSALKILRDRWEHRVNLPAKRAEHQRHVIH